MKNLVIDIEKHFPSAYKIFSPADYYSPFIPLDQMECLQVITDADYCKETYSINPVLEYSWGLGPYSKTAMPSMSSIPSASSFSFGSSGDASGNSVPSSDSLGDRIKGAVTSIMNIF